MLARSLSHSLGPATEKGYDDSKQTKERSKEIGENEMGKNNLWGTEHPLDVK